MSDAQLSLDLGKPHRNHYLFSDHYLEEVLRREPVWTAAQTPARDLLAWLRALYAQEGALLPDYSEAQLEERWFKPILGQLGHVWEPQAAVPGLDKGIKKPDYVFFADEDARRAAVADQRTEEYARHALAVGEVKAWSIPLSRKLSGAPTFDNGNPMFQIDYYLKATGAAWGIVSNGRYWRLVQRDTSYKLDVYFEVDLLEALTTADDRRALAVINYLVVFFRQAAFRPEARGAIFLDEVLRGSRTYAVALESDLRDNAYKALEQLITGFFAPSANKLDLNDPAHRDQVYRNSLLLLYRLLFLFYGESRGLLPMRHDAYRDRSLSALARDCARLVDDHKIDALPPMTRQYWTRLQELFTIIDGGDPALNAHLGVPRYNGGLFDPRRHAFLEEKAVGDRHLARAIDYLARRRKTENGVYAGLEAVDYRTLGVRQLGSIYEGLLEYKVSVAAEAMVTVRKGGKETWLPAGERGKAKAIETRQLGELYLATDKGERKATGSYYTPDYIVKYIVEQTLGPLVAEARRQAAGASDERRVTSEERRIQAARRFEERILALNVLDPAMGSGHFLVEATDFLARALVEGAAESRPGESDVTYWRRRVVEACIYGVDKNELAVELAKLSLWLATVAADKPLSFLDHHLRHGDSLIGAWLRDLEKGPVAKSRGAGVRGSGGEQAELLFDESAFTTNAGQAVGGMAVIERIMTDDLDAVHDKERLLREVRDEHLARWRRLADLWVSAYFGNAMSAAEYADLARRLQGRRGATLSDEQAARYLQHPAVVHNDYFHWELEFPEVFFDQYGRPKGEGAGFDAVVGNPPYVRQESLTGASKDFFQTAYEQVQHGTADIYVYFLSLGIANLRQHGRVGFICSSQFRRLAYGAPIRAFLAESSILREIVDFGTRQVFDDATTYPIILIAERGIPTIDDTFLLIDGGSSINNNITNAPRRNVLLPKEREQWVFASGKLQGILEGSSDFVSLFKVLSAQVFRGVTTGFNDAFVIDSATRQALIAQDARSSEIIKPYVRGEDLHRWYRDDPQLFLIFTRRGTNLLEYPAIQAYLERFRERLDVKPIDWDDSHKWLGRKPGNYKWFEIQDSVEYYKAFEMPRIHSTKVSFRPSFSISQEPLYASNTSYVLPIPDLETGLFALAVLNSSLSAYYCRQVFAPKANDYYEVQPEKLDSFPIPLEWQSVPLMGSESENHFEVVKVHIGANQKRLAHTVLTLLADQMIAMYQQKQSQTADFWTDLEGTTDPATFRKLRDKGKQEAGLAVDPALAPFVRAESKSSRGLDDSLAWDEAAFKAFVRALAGPVGNLSALLRVYQRHAPPFRDLTDRIARTDWLIDQIVYKLYGLTEEEIAIVEGRE